jgi:putative flavoprotein involved in K+ transport
VSEGRGAFDHEAVVCGAGAAGLSSAAALKQRGVSSVVLERSDHVGSSWRARYDTLRLNTLGWMSTQPGYHIGRRVRHFPSRDEWVDYLERYARHHGLQIAFRTEARRIEREDRGWSVDTSRGPLRSRFVVVATGYDRDPTMPHWPGRESFSGELIHASEYRNAAPYRGRDVLVVGPNVTGSEVAYFLAEGGAARVRVAVRTPPNILRRCRFGLPLNPTAPILEHLPAAVGDRLAGLSQRLMFGDLSRYGLPRPPMGVVSTNRKRRQGPAIDDGFVDAVKTGRVEIVAGVEAFDGADVVLADDSRIQPDAVIAATGYSRGLEPLVGHLAVLDSAGYPQRIRGEAHPDAPGLYFVGYVTPLYGQLRGIRLEAKRLARAVAKEKVEEPDET